MVRGIKKQNRKLCVNEIAQFRLAEIMKEFVEKNVRKNALGRLEAIIKPHIF